MKHFNFLLPLLLAACTNSGGEQPTRVSEAPKRTPTPLADTVKPDLPAVTALFETAAVVATSEDDAADDPAVWYNALQPDQSLIIGSNKTKGVDVYDLNGRLLRSYDVGRINNVDVRQDVKLGDHTYDIVAGSNRTTNTLDFWFVARDSMALVPLGQIASGLTEVYGFCLYHTGNDGPLYALVNSKTGKVEQWRIDVEANKVSGELVRTLQLPSQVEGMVADDPQSKLYVGVEAGGIYRFDAQPDAAAEGVFLTDSDSLNPNIVFDIEGLTIYPTGKESGYLIASSQGNNSFAVFERSGDNVYIGSFKIDAKTVDAVEETDGIDVCHRNLGKQFPQGIFICQDGFNFDGADKSAQNFKVVDWRDISSVIKGFAAP